jgi:hypothetical protein
MEKFGYGLLNVALGATLALSGCKSNTAAPIVDMNNGPDPAAANMAQVDPNAPATAYSGTTSAPVTRVLGQQSYAPAAPVSGEQYPETDQSQGYSDQYSDPAYDQSQVDAGAQTLYAQDAPPPLPEYQQPELTEPGDLWTPGYWAYAPSGYYWVPGAWVAPPYSNALWTPPYWGYCGHRYCFHGGYWGLHIGFYGGISYGFGYFGHGYEGGYWNNGNFFYNQRVNRINVENVRNVYVRNVTVVNTRVSYNGPGGIQARPQPAELAVLHERRTPPMQTQVAQIRAASTNRQQFYAENHGKPAVAVAAVHYTADRTPPAAIEPRANEVRGNPAAVNQQQRGLQEQQQRNVQQQATQRNLQQEQQQRAQQQAVQQRQVPQQPAARGTIMQNRSPEAQRAMEPARVAPQPLQNRPQPQAVPQRAAPQPMARPEPQRAAPQPMARPQPEPQRAAPEPQRAAPAPRPQPEARPAPAPHPAAPPPHPAPAPRPPENHPAENHPHH